MCKGTLPFNYNLNLPENNTCCFLLLEDFFNHNVTAYAISARRIKHLSKVIPINYCVLINDRHNELITLFLNMQSDIQLKRK
jgi:hypothetical protein